MTRWFLLAWTVLAIHGLSFAQTEKFDIATFTPPAGWERSNNNGTVSLFNSKTAPGGAVFCQIVLYPSKNSLGAPMDNFKDAWKNIVAVPMKSTVLPQVEATKNGGWDLVTGIANIAFSGINHTSIVVTATGSGKTMSFHVKTLGQDYLPVISKFFEQLSLDAKASVSTRGSGSDNVAGARGLDDIQFIAPPGWQAQRVADHVRLQNPESGCLIIIFAPGPSTGDLEKDAATAFDLMYRGWQFRKAGEQKYTLSKGFTPQGLEFYMMAGLMGKSSSDGAGLDGFEEGSALAIKSGGQVIVVVARHNTTLLAHDSCKKYESWQRFFNTFAVKNAAPVKNEASAIVGRWSMAESGGTGEYVFAANGNYALIAAIGSTFTRSDANYDYLYVRTSAFSGDGSYSLSGNTLTLRKRGTAPEQVQVRFDKVNHGGVGWKDRIYILKSDRQGLSEASYEKQGR